MSDHNIDFDTAQDRNLRKLRKGARRAGDSELMAYVAPDGTKLAVAGDSEAPFVKIINTEDAPVQVTIVGGLSATEQVVGNVAHDAVDTGNPVKVGGRAAGSILGFSEVTAGDRSDLATSLRGQLQVVLAGGSAWSKFTPASNFVPAGEWLVNNGACIIGRLTITLSQDEAVDLYAFVYDATSQGAGPIVERFFIPAGGSAVRDYTTEGGLALGTGCFVILSTESTSMAAAPVGGFLHGVFQAT